MKIWKGIKVQSRNYASLKFIIYTMAGSLGLLLAIQLLGVLFNTYDLQTLYTNWGALDPNNVMLHFFKMALTVSTVKTIAFWAFVVAFAIKVPVWPFHTWLPDAHTEAPTPGSMLLAGVSSNWAPMASCAWCCHSSRWRQNSLPGHWLSWRQWPSYLEHSQHLVNVTSRNS